jgi:hypothetical protein
MSIRDWLQRHWEPVVILLIVGSYVGPYVFLSAAGKYWPSPSGKLRYDFGLAVTDRALWEPKGMYLSRRQTIRGETITQGNFWGYFYEPMILLDRAYWHPTVDYFEE